MEKNKKENKESVWQKVSSVLSTILLIFSIIIMLFTVISTRTIGEGNISYFFDYKPMIVNSDSMKGIFDAGDIIVTKKMEYNDLKIGDIVTYFSVDPTNYGEILSHRIIKIANTSEGTVFFTKGDMNEFEDLYPVIRGNVVGTYCFRIPKAGYFFNFLKTIPGYILCIFLPFAALIFIQLAHFIGLLKEYKAEIEAVKIKEDKEREEKHQSEMDDMKKQIEALQEQLKQNEKSV